MATITHFHSKIILIFLLLSFTFSAFGQKSNVTPADSTKAADAFYEGVKEKTLGNASLAQQSFAEALKLNPNFAAAAYELSRLYTLSGDAGDAVYMAEKAQKIDPQNKYYKDQYLLTLINFRFFPQAVKELDKRIKNDPFQDRNYFKKAFVLLQLNQYKEAINTLNKFEKVKGVQLESIEQKCEIYLQLKKPNEAIKEAQKLYDKDPNSEDYSLFYAQILIEAGQLKQAKEVLQKAYIYSNGSARIAILLADFYQQEKNEAKMFEMLNIAFSSQILEIDPKVQILSGLIPEQNTDTVYFLKLLQLANNIVSAHPDDSKAYAILGDVLFNVNRLKDARNAFKSAITLEKESQRFLIWQQIMFISLQLSDWDTLMMDASKAIEIFPSQAIAHYCYGVALQQKKDCNMAIKSYKKALALIVDNALLEAQIYGNLADCANEIKDYSASDSYFDKALKLEPDNATLLNNYAYYLSLRKENIEKAERMVMKALAIDSTNTSFLDTYAWLLFIKKDYQLAKTFIDKAIKLEKPSAVVLEHAGDIYYFNNMINEAIAFWKRAQTLGLGTSTTLDQKVKNGKYIE